MRHLTALALALALALGTAPALAEEGTTDGPEEEAFVVDTEEVAALREAGVGYGAISKLMALAGMKGVTVSVDSFLTAAPLVDGEYEFEFGALQADFDKDERKAFKHQARLIHRLIKANPAAKGMVESDDAEAEADDAPVAKEDLLAEAFGVEVSVVTGLREQDIGWGAVFHLLKLSSATGTSLEELRALGADGDGGFSFGKLRKELGNAELAAFGEKPRNFGQLMAAAKRGPKNPKNKVGD